ncbi:MAG TPA: hypothetical protein PLC88_09685 [Syntrophomonas sp.]|nr:hypothetical protein [Syntrophomonas sp.]HRW13428.1 hypothetical protein [Syntrophomonas sp.]
MKERNGKNAPNEHFEFGKQCTYCRAQRSHEYELCKYCGVYRQGLKNMAELWPGNIKPSIGELMARFDFASREMIKLYCQSGLDRKQIETIMDKIVRDNIRSLAMKK